MSGGKIGRADGNLTLMGRPAAILAPIGRDPAEIPASARTPWLRCGRLARTVEQFFDPFDIQSFEFSEDWKEIPGVRRLLAKAEKELTALDHSWPDWSLADAALGLYYPFFAETFGRMQIQPTFELPVWPVSGESIGRYVHRFLTSATSGIEGMTFSERNACAPPMDRPAPSIVTETLDLARRCLSGAVDMPRLLETRARWIRMGVIRNGYHKPGTVSLRGRCADGNDAELTIRTRVARSWQNAEFDVALRPGLEARLRFLPPLRPVYLRLVRAEGAGRTWPLALRAGGPAKFEDMDDEICVFIAYSERSFVRFVPPPDSTPHRIAFQFQIRDDPVAQLALLEGLTKGQK